MKAQNALLWMTLGTEVAPNIINYEDLVRYRISLERYLHRKKEEQIMKDWLTKFEDEADLEELEDYLDEDILRLAQMIEEEESRPALVNPIRISEVFTAYRLLNSALEGEKVMVTYKLHEPWKSAGSVSIIGEDLVILNTEAFARATRLASNLEAYSRTDGSICVTLTFYGLTKPII